MILFSHGLHSLIVEVLKKLVVEEHAREIGYSGVVNLVRGVVHGLYPSI